MFASLTFNRAAAARGAKWGALLARLAFLLLVAAAIVSILDGSTWTPR
jgi:hypothetical protein